MKTLSKWIEVTGHFDHENDGEFVFDCELPEDGQEILVTLIGGDIGRDICYIDKMGYHLESGWDWDDVFKWAPMPPAWWEETHDKRTEMHACDCVSRQAAIDAHYEYCNKHPDAGFPVWSLKILEDLPSAQPEIVRCGQCKYAEVADKEDAQDGYTCQFHRGSIWFSGSYCSWAERRTDE